MQSMLSRYLEQGFATLMKQQDAMRADMSKVLSATPLAPFMDLARANMDAFAKMQSSFFGAPGAPAQSTATPSEPDAAAEPDAQPPKSPNDDTR